MLCIYSNSKYNLHLELKFLRPVLENVIPWTQMQMNIWGFSIKWWVLTKGRVGFVEISSAISNDVIPWWRHPIETFPTLLALFEGNSSVTGEFPAQRPVKWSFDVFLDLRLNKRLSKQSWGWWFDMPSGSSWRHGNDHWKPEKLWNKYDQTPGQPCLPVT